MSPSLSRPFMSRRMNCSPQDALTEAAGNFA
jgi:hypothetical protein